MATPSNPQTEQIRQAETHSMPRHGLMNSLLLGALVLTLFTLSVIILS